MENAFDSHWITSGSICDSCCPTPIDFAKKDRDREENILKLKNLFDTLSEAYYQAQKFVLDEACLGSNELDEEFIEYKNEFNQLLKLLELE